MAPITPESDGVAVGPKDDDDNNNDYDDAAATARVHDSSGREYRIVDHPVLGNVYPIVTPGQDDLASSVSVPTFASCDSRDDDGVAAAPNRRDASGEPGTDRNMQFRGLEGVLEHGPAFVLDGIFSPRECRALVDACENSLGFGSYHLGKNRHGALQIVVTEALARRMGERLAPYVNVRQVEALRRRMEATKNRKDNVRDSDYDDECFDDLGSRLMYRGLNRRWRFYRYEPGGIEHFAPHIDAGFPPSGLTDDGAELMWDCPTSAAKEVVSRLTVLFYLNDDFEGGHTNFFEPVARTRRRRGTLGDDDPSLLLIASVRPVTGSCLVFPQGVGDDAVAHARENWPLHEGSPVAAGSTQPKYVVRSDVLFETVRETNMPPKDDPLFRYDSAVRRTFLPSSSVLDANFLSHVESLYNPHMGVENLGPFLYSFVRFTKVRRLVEIGAGYTTVWILQALRDNDEEMLRIHELEQSGQCRLLNWPWTNAERVEAHVSPRLGSPSQLLCVDNCEHQKETASGVSSVAETLGLGSYLRFVRGDAFELHGLGRDSPVDVVWCDFGVGSRMKDFCASTWDSLRPGGFLLCHSTLTNQRTREWLEAARAHRGIEETGLPAGQYVELSLLEPHKHYQNSVSIFQKRKGYIEPIYSEFA
jgi:predicted O-methyltransferase YrrM